MTPATDRAALLRAVAEHLEAHPELPLVSITGNRDVWLQITEFTAAAVAAWARSLGATEVVAEQQPGADYTRLVLPDVTLGGHTVEVWGAVQPALDVWHGARVPVADLEVSS